ncbi:MAG: DUF262 domain-containing protein [Cyanobacteria bacterium SIG32]|nr:DUF262 domain-containing protein [Cyanobacteria bacterium SIG32]
MNNSWSMKEYTATEIHKDQESNKLVVPRYQRGVVWKDSQKADLIDSIKKGLPFGSILLYKDDNKNNYRIIDGLQRSNTIYEFIENPSKFFNEDDIDDNSMEELYNLANVNSGKEFVKEKMVEVIINWIKNDYKTMDAIKEIQYNECAEKLSEEFPTLQGKEKEVTKIIKPMLYLYKQICTTMVEAKIPAIVIKGDEDYLPVIFERINSKGSQLTKWQIYAATWSDDKIIVDNDLKRIVDINKERYESQNIENNIEIENFDPITFSKKNELSTFELLFGFGKMISEQYPHLFSSAKQINEVESIGFNLVNACLGLKNSEIKNLNKNLVDIIGNDEDINKFLKEVIECIKIVDKAVAITTKFKSNVRHNSSPIHTEMQICSMIASVFINKFMDYDINDDDQVINKEVHLDSYNKNWRNYINDFRNNAIKTYLVDVIQTNWRGSGDRKLNNVILNKEYYTKDIEKQDIINILKIWHENIKLERKEYLKVQNPKEAERIILNIIYSNILTAAEQINDECYDIEHIATKERMKKIMNRFNKNNIVLRLPLSSIGNLCFLPEDLNRGKKDKTIYQSKLTNIDEIETKFSFTEEKDLIWINNDNLSQDEITENYINFINKRFEKICDKLIRVLYPN